MSVWKINKDVVYCQQPTVQIPTMAAENGRHEIDLEIDDL